MHDTAAFPPLLCAEHVVSSSSSLPASLVHPPVLSPRYHTIHHPPISPPNPLALSLPRDIALNTPIIHTSPNDGNPLTIFFIGAATAAALGASPPTLGSPHTNTSSNTILTSNPSHVLFLLPPSPSPPFTTLRSLHLVRRSTITLWLEPRSLWYPTALPQHQNIQARYLLHPHHPPSLHPPPQKKNTSRSLVIHLTRKICIRPTFELYRLTLVAALSLPRRGSSQRRRGS